MAAKQDLTGRTFGRWEVLSEDPVRRGTQLHISWLCRCACGTERSVLGHLLVNGGSESCGCLQRERASEANRTHGASRTGLHVIWKGMIQRCHNEENPNYKRYGAIGIGVFDGWRGEGGFERFRDHVGPRPSDGHSIDRIKNELGYEPGNVRWATDAQQGRNKTVNHMITVDGVTRTLADWADATGLQSATIRRRLASGWEPKRAVTSPPTPSRWDARRTA